jgi:hypothetical protein
MAVELVVEPLAVVCGAVRSIIEGALSSHLVILELALVVSAVFKQQLSLAMLTALQDGSFISAAVLVSLDGEDELVFLLEHRSLGLLLERWHSLILYCFQLFELRPREVLILTIGKAETRLGANISRGMAHG